MRALLIASVAVVVGLILALAYAPPASADACTQSSCGAPRCWNPNVRVRPDMTRSVTVSCLDTKSARIVGEPAHNAISNLSTDWYGLHFDVRPDDGAPRFDEVAFELEGYEETIRLPVKIEVVPREENSPPYCSGDSVSQRSDGASPVEVHPHPSCWDPDGDEFVMEGGPPGTHPDAPKHVPAGANDADWRYRTATTSGTETPKIWATDSLGARSEDATLEVTVGPGVDREPRCNSSTYSPEGWLVHARPGKVRRFGVACSDPDGDPFVPTLSSPPERGAIPLFVPGPVFTSSYLGYEQGADATYVPADEGTEPDRFSVTATGASGATTTPMWIKPRPLPTNGGGGCGYSTASVTVNVPSELWINCSDQDGDPFAVEIVRAPQHGTITPAVLTPALYGSEQITIPYVPDAGYVGYDCVQVKITDGNGLEFDIPIDIWVAPPPPPVEPPDLPDLPPLPRPPIDVELDPQAVREQVSEALGTTAVKRIRKAVGLEVWARRELSRRDLLRRGQAPGIALICRRRCQARTVATLSTGQRALRATRSKAVTAATAGRLHVVSLSVGRSQRRVLRRGRAVRGEFKLSVRPLGGERSSLQRSIPVAR
jgi:hypothetical protein